MLLPEITMKNRVLMFADALSVRVGPRLDVLRERSVS
jgi:hypothetical protein